MEDAEQIIEELGRLMSRAENIVRKRGGAPKFRTLVKSAVDELRAINKGRSKKENMEMDIKELLKVLGMSEDSDENAVLARVKELNERPQPPQPDPNQPKPDGDPLPQAVAAELAKRDKVILELQTREARREAIATVDGAIKARKFIPAVRDNLISMAMNDPAEFAKYVKNTPDNAILAQTGEIGSDGDGGANRADLEPTAQEMRIAAQMGNTREQIIEQKALELGRNVPEPVALVLAQMRKK
jgi:hypothetical protein